MRTFLPKLGKKSVKHDDRTFRLAAYLDEASLPHPLRRVNWANGVTAWSMMKNDTIGDCTIACPGHMEELWTMKESGQEVVIADQAILDAYIAVTGQEGAAYDPATGANDNGCAILDVLKYWRTTGIGGHQISAFASVDPANHAEVKVAVQLFGGVNIGLALPISAQAQVGQVWDVPAEGATGDGEPGSWGGHCVPAVAYFSDETITCVTWGGLQNMTWKFWDAYCDEAYAVISPEWCSKNSCNPNGVNIKQLMADLSALK